MSEIITKRIEVVVERLKDLAKDRESFFNDETRAICPIGRYP